MRDGQDHRVQYTPQIEPNTGTTSECPICRERMVTKCVVQPCGHEFDLECIQIWTSGHKRANRSCPMCRHEIESLEYLAVAKEILPSRRSRHPRDLRPLLSRRSSHGSDEMPELLSNERQLGVFDFTIRIEEGSPNEAEIERVTPASEAGPVHWEHGYILPDPESSPFSRRSSLVQFWTQNREALRALRNRSIVFLDVGDENEVVNTAPGADLNLSEDLGGLNMSDNGDDLRPDSPDISDSGTQSTLEHEEDNFIDERGSVLQQARVLMETEFRSWLVNIFDTLLSADEQYSISRQLMRYFTMSRGDPRSGLDALEQVLLSRRVDRQLGTLLTEDIISAYNEFYLAARLAEGSLI